ncbi:hypothetical protein PIB30_033394 [Stylosanthes scabra]|uniref:Uncharacterized protein n=1 Tax=Stylosanthes scabra TaxID=79078 RepID=A0ABU6QC42_9FABA|nr:hypothetical protein [Stylosanthes scabra]
MARKGSSSLAKGKATAYGPPTQASPRLAAMRARLAASSRPETPDAPVTPAPPTAKRTARISMKYYSMKLADRDGPSNAANNITSSWDLLTAPMTAALELLQTTRRMIAPH